jgi:iron complex outermembrane receptor protein
MPAMRSARTVRSLTLFNTPLMLSAFTVPAFADIETVVVTAEKRVENLQTVPVAVTAFTAATRDKIGIQTIQDMANFTPGMTYSTSTDRVTIRGISRQTNVLSADSGVANYTDGIYQSFAVEAGRSPLDLERVEILRGPQGTLYGRNSIGGAINQITVRPSDELKGEIRADYGAYDHSLIDGSITGPINDDWQWRVYADWEHQGIGYTKNAIGPDEGQVLNKWYVEGQLQGKINNIDIWDRGYWTVWNNGAGDAGSASGGWTPADFPTYETGQGALEQNAGYGCTVFATQPKTPATDPTYPNVAAAGGGTTVTGAIAPVANPCQNPAVQNPWHIARITPYTTTVPGAYFNTLQATFHEDGYDVKFVNGFEWYRYVLTGPVASGNGQYPAPISSYTIGTSAPPAIGFPTIFGLLPFQGCVNPFGINPFTPKGVSFPCPPLTVHPQSSFNYQQQEFFTQNEVNFVSTGNGPFRWQTGLYWFQQHESQPVSTSNVAQSDLSPFQLSTPFGTTVPEGPFTLPHSSLPARWFDDRISFNDTSLAAYGQADYKLTDELTLTGGLRFSYDKKYGLERSRLVEFGLPITRFIVPPLNIPLFIEPETLGAYTPAIDLTPIATCPPTVLDYCTAPDKGVNAPAAFDPATGFAARRYTHSSNALTGTVKITWQPDEQTTAYAYYSRGYKGGGFNTGIFSFINPKPWVNPEHVNAYEIGLKKTFGEFLVLDTAAYYYDYSSMQVPVEVAASPGGVNSPEFISIPHAVSTGFEAEAFITPVEHMLAVVSYSFDEAHITSSLVGQFSPVPDPITGLGKAFFGGVADPADPNGLAPGGKPLFTPLQCANTQGTSGALCSVDIYTLNGTVNTVANGFGGIGTTTGACVKTPSANQGCGYGWVIPQSLKGNRLPNVPKNKIAIALSYDWNIPELGTITPAVTWRWVDKQYGTVFSRFYNSAPSWDQWDARVDFASPDSHWNFIVYGRNLGNKLGYAQGAIGTRLSGTVNTGGNTAPGSGPPGGGPGGAATQGYGSNPTVGTGTYCDGSVGNGGANQCNFVQGLVGPTTSHPAGFGAVRGESAFGTISNYNVNPPLTYGVQLQYRF